MGSLGGSPIGRTSWPPRWGVPILSFRREGRHPIEVWWERSSPQRLNDSRRWIQICLVVCPCKESSPSTQIAHVGVSPCTHNSASRINAFQKKKKKEITKSWFKILGGEGQKGGLLWVQDGLSELLVFLKEVCRRALTLTLRLRLYTRHTLQRKDLLIERITKRDRKNDLEGGSDYPIAPSEPLKKCRISYTIIAIPHIPKLCCLYPQPSLLQFQIV